MLSNFYKWKPTDKIWHIDRIGFMGEYLFSFDKKKIYNFWTDYPHKLTEEEIEIFKKENPIMARLKE